MCFVPCSWGSKNENGSRPWGFFPLFPPPPPPITPHPPPLPPPHTPPPPHSPPPPPWFLLIRLSFLMWCRPLYVGSSSSSKQTPPLVKHSFFFFLFSRVLWIQAIRFPVVCLRDIKNAGMVVTSLFRGDKKAFASLPGPVFSMCEKRCEGVFTLTTGGFDLRFFFKCISFGRSPCLCVKVMKFSLHF